MAGMLAISVEPREDQSVARNATVAIDIAVGIRYTWTSLV